MATNGKRTLRALQVTALAAVLLALAICNSGCASGAIEADAEVKRLTERVNNLAKDFEDLKGDMLRGWALQDQKDEANALAWEAADRWINRKLEEERREDESE